MKNYIRILIAVMFILVFCAASYALDETYNSEDGIEWPQDTTESESAPAGATDAIEWPQDTDESESVPAGSDSSYGSEQDLGAMPTYDTGELDSDTYSGTVEGQESGELD